MFTMASKKRCCKLLVGLAMLLSLNSQVLAEQTRSENEHGPDSFRTEGVPENRDTTPIAGMQNFPGNSEKLLRLRSGSI